MHHVICFFCYLTTLLLSPHLISREFPAVYLKEILDIHDDGILIVSLFGDTIPEVFRQEIPVKVKGCEKLHIREKNSRPHEEMTEQKKYFLAQSKQAITIKLTNVERDTKCFRLYAKLVIDKENQSQAICDIFTTPATLEESWTEITQQMAKTEEELSSIIQAPSTTALHHVHTDKAQLISMKLENQDKTENTPDSLLPSFKEARETISTLLQERISSKKPQPFAQPTQTQTVPAVFKRPSSFHAAKLLRGGNQPSHKIDVTISKKSAFPIQPEPTKKPGQENKNSTIPR
ncbi:hypothetical protein CI610_02346 [invertebrate metagenome]|uniref:Uncharacterized protein n=1 Tax=invertebrate metagenome TaxID=1711999 RepID=A0A2H9T665_9ZZZZ